MARARITRGIESALGEATLDVGMRAKRCVMTTRPQAGGIELLIGAPRFELGTSSPSRLRSATRDGDSLQTSGIAAPCRAANYVVWRVVRHAHHTHILPKNRSADVFDDLNELVEAVAVVAGEIDELSGSLDDGAAFGCPCDRDAAAAPELE